MPSVIERIQEAFLLHAAGCEPFPGKIQDLSDEVVQALLRDVGRVLPPHKEVPQLARCVTVMVQDLVFFQKLVELAELLQKPQMEGGHAEGVADRLRAAAPELHGTAVGQVFVFKGPQVLQILQFGFECVCLKASAIRIVVFPFDLRELHVGQKRRRGKVQIFPVAFYAVKACRGDIVQQFVLAVKITLVHPDIVRIDTVCAVFPEHIAHTDHPVVFSQ